MIRYVRMLVAHISCASSACTCTDSVQATSEAEAVREFERRGWSRADAERWHCLKHQARKEVA